MSILSTIKRNWFIKLGALLVALALWVHAKTNEGYDRIISLPLQVSEASGRFVAANSIPDRIDVRVHGTGKDLLFYSGRGRVDVSLNVASRQVVTVEPSLEDVRGFTASDHVALIGIESPASFVADMDFLDSRQVPVVSAARVQLRAGYTQVGPVRCDPPVIHIRGPRRFVREVASVRTDTVLVADRHADLDMEVHVLPPPGLNIQLAPQRVRVRADIQPLLERRFEDVAVVVRRAPSRVRARTVPETVTVDVVGGSDVIRALTAEDVHVELDYRRRFEMGLDDLPLDVQLPEHVRLVRVQPQTASLIVGQ